MNMTDFKHNVFIIFLSYRSHLVTVPPGTMLADVLMSSPMFLGDDGQPLASSRAGFELGFDPADDPELAMVKQLYIQLICYYLLN